MKVAVEGKAMDMTRIECTLRPNGVLKSDAVPVKTLLQLLGNPKKPVKFWLFIPAK